MAPWEPHKPYILTFERRGVLEKKPMTVDEVNKDANWPEEKIILQWHCDSNRGWNSAPFGALHSLGYHLSCLAQGGGPPRPVTSLTRLPLAALGFGLEIWYENGGVVTSTLSHIPPQGGEDDFPLAMCGLDHFLVIFFFDTEQAMWNTPVHSA